MNFKDISILFEKLENTSKRLEKVLILRDFAMKNNEQIGLLFDIISADFQRKINKRNLSISLKTVFSILSFLSNESRLSIEKKFNTLGDIGEIASEVFDKKKNQTSLSSGELMLDEIVSSLNKISIIFGKDSNKRKKEILTKLFLDSKSSLEFKYLARLLIDDLRIGVSVGVLREACVNLYFPKIIGIQQICDNCNYVSLNQKKCYSCNENLDLKNQENKFKEKFEILEVGTPKEELGLDTYLDVLDQEEEIKYILRNSKENSIIKTQNPRLIYNTFLSLFEMKYNLINSFEEIFAELKENKNNILNLEIILGKPIRSMLGTREKTIEDSFEISKKPALIDFKYDGLRVQVHNNKGKIKLFSRNLDDITKQFPDVVEYIKTNFSDISFVLDTECVAYDFDKQKFLEFQILSRRILTKNIKDVSHIKVIVKSFDILYLNGETLINEIYSKRRKIMTKLLLNRPLKQELCFNIKNLI